MGGTKALQFEKPPIKATQSTVFLAIQVLICIYIKSMLYPSFYFRSLLLMVS